MDAKMRANFINSVAGGKKITCPSCNTLNDADSKFCMTCGSKLEFLGSANENVTVNNRIKNDQNEKKLKVHLRKAYLPGILYHLRSWSEGEDNDDHNTTYIFRMGHGTDCFKE